MKRNKWSIFIYCLFGLAAIGLLSQLLRHTASFFSSIFTMIGVSIAIFAVFYFVFLRKRQATSDTKKYRQAVKQSKAKYKQVQHEPKKKAPFQGKHKKNKRASHLHVIDGNKR